MGKSKKPSKSASERFSFTPGVSKKEKTSKAKYLTKRIDNLFQSLEDWIEGMENLSIKKSKVNVDGEKLPAADILAGKKSFVTIKPSGLYAFGVNCRLDIISNKETNILFDVAKESAPADWQLISEAGKKPKKLTKMIFRNLLKRIKNEKQN